MFLSFFSIRYVRIILGFVFLMHLTGCTKVNKMDGMIKTEGYVYRDDLKSSPGNLTLPYIKSVSYTHLTLPTICSV